MNRRNFLRSAGGVLVAAAAPAIITSKGYVPAIALRNSGTLVFDGRDPALWNDHWLDAFRYALHMAARRCGKTAWAHHRQMARSVGPTLTFRQPSGLTLPQRFRYSPEGEIAHPALTDRGRNHEQLA